MEAFGSPLELDFFSGDKIAVKQLRRENFTKQEQLIGGQNENANQTAREREQ